MAKKAGQTVCQESLFDFGLDDEKRKHAMLSPVVRKKDDICLVAPAEPVPIAEGHCGKLSDWEDEPAVRQILQDIRSGLLAHAYLITGSGSNKERKRDIAKAFAHALLCERPEHGIPCCSCRSCRLLINQGAHPDLHCIEANGSSLKMDQVNDLRKFFKYGSATTRHHVYIIQGPELLTTPTANSLLKVLEEPATQTVFILVTEEDSLPIDTIVSRCRVVAVQEQVAGAGASTDVPCEFEEIHRSLIGNKGSDLLKGIRSLGKDRDAGKNLLQYLCGVFERSFKDRKAVVDMHPEDVISLMVLGDCIEMILRGIRQLEENVNVSLLLVLVLRDLQQALAV